MIRLIERVVLLALVALAFAGCAATTDSPPPPEVKNAALRVGVSPDYPPIVFKQNDRVTGVEVDLALRLGNALGSPVEFVEMGWDQLVPSLMEGKIDIIMSGMTITEARKVRINFTDPYLKSGLATLMRAEEASEYGSLQKIGSTVSRVGVVRGTTGEAYVRANFLNAATVIPLAKANDAAFALINRRIDLFRKRCPFHRLARLRKRNTERLLGTPERRISRMGSTSRRLQTPDAGELYPWELEEEWDIERGPFKMAPILENV
jgi:ABC-type amino acid transport substrate-binding protein